ncbi:hypothetical protein WR25_25026 [Diploscapter pachys]|uniref:Uncharacterized protein n=1 Tax=Diploscapter pachys TaxID=2018661 RepID=A0A2A2KJ21_9BILA|nr:hypothetical protein WR25_25026 [Diploscapter pachys]
MQCVVASCLPSSRSTGLRWPSPAQLSVRQGQRGQQADQRSPGTDQQEVAEGFQQARLGVRIRLARLEAAQQRVAEHFEAALVQPRQ